MIGDRLKLARKKAGLSLRALAAALDGEVSAQAIGKYERGEMMPGSLLLGRLTEVLHVTPEYLLSDQVEELEGVEFRSHSGTSAKDRARVEAEVIEQLERYLAIEEILGIEPVTSRSALVEQHKIQTEAEAADLADNLREAWNLGLDPIPNMTALLEERGFKVLLLPLPARVSGLTCLVRCRGKTEPAPAIVVNRYGTLERRRHTLGHELAHRLIDDRSPVKHERASDVFAGAFLVPQAHLVGEVGAHREALGYQEIVQLKRKYRVSAAGLLMRLRQAGIITQATLTYAFQTYARGWRKTEPDPLEPDDRRGEYERPRRFERLCYWALAERYISPGKAMALLGQSLEDIEQAMRGPEARADHC